MNTCLNESPFRQLYLAFVASARANCSRWPLRVLLCGRKMGVEQLRVVEEEMVEQHNAEELHDCDADDLEEEPQPP
eukprot:scaffold136091_cov20-Tisochrysis_lutea.AAC.2